MRQDFSWTPFFTLLIKENKRFLRVASQTLIVPIVNSSLYLLIFGVSLGGKISMGGTGGYLAFLIPGILMMGVLNNAFQNSSSSIGTSRFHGDLEDLRIVPLSPLQIVLAMGLGGLMRGLSVGALIFGVGQIFYYFTYGSFLGVVHPLSLLFFLVTGGLAFANLGISVGFWAKNFDQLTAVGGFILLPLLYLGGVFFSLSNLHPVWQTVSRANPMLYYINGVRFGFLGVSDVPATTSAFISFLTMIVLFIFAFKKVQNGQYGRW